MSDHTKGKWFISSVLSSAGIEPCYLLADSTRTAYHGLPLEVLMFLVQPSWPASTASVAVESGSEFFVVLSDVEALSVPSKTQQHNTPIIFY